MIRLTPGRDALLHTLVQPRLLPPKQIEEEIGRVLAAASFQLVDQMLRLWVLDVN